MDGYVNTTNGAAGYDEGDKEGGETEVGAADCSGQSDSELVSLERNLERIEILDDDLEQPDGQRSSLSLEDDGGTHFEPHSLETVIRRGMHVRDTDAGNPSMQEGSDDNDVVFYPAQKLNFDNDDNGEDEDEDNDNEDSLDMAADIVDNNTVGNREYIPQRPDVNGSDTAEHGAYGFMPTAQDQGQNVRIIEGHDSSLLDDSGNSTFGFNFLQSQMTHLPLLSPVNSALGSNNRLEDEVHNLYDSLEREDGSSLYGEADDHVMESNQSEYFSPGSMSLVVANSQIPDCDSLWAQDDSSDHGNYLPHPQQNFQGGHGAERNYSKHHSPPQNFQVDASSVFVPRRRSGFVGEGNMGGYGDVHGAEGDNTDALTLELSEEGLSQSTQMYAQPVSASNISALSGSFGNSACKGDMGIFHHQSQNDWTNNRLPAHNSNQLFLFDNATKSVHQVPLNSQPKNLIWSQGMLNDETKASSHIEGDGLDIKSNERQAGPGSFSNEKHTGDINQSGRRSVVSKIQTRRPAVQGSASSGDNKRSGVMNSRQGSVSSRKAILPAKSGSHNDTSGRSNSTVSRQNSGGEQVRGNSGGALSAANAQSRHPQGQMSALSMTSRSNSHTSITSHVNSTNSRVGGVGKESHMSTNPQASLNRGAAPFSVKTESNHPMTMAQRLAGGKGDTAHATVQSPHSNGGIPQQHQHSHMQYSNPSDRIRPAMDSHSEPHKSQSFTKQRSTVHHLQNSPSIDDNVSEPQNCRSIDSQPSDNQHHGSVGGTGSSNRNPQNQIHQYHHSTQQPLPSEYGTQQMSHQSYQVGLPIQVAYTCSPSGSEGSHHNNREVVDPQVETFKRHVPRQSLTERSHLDNDIQGVEEVRSHLHNMLNMGAESSTTGLPGHDHTDASLELMFPEQSLNRQLYFDSDASSFIGNSHQNDMSDILENFPTFSSKMFSHMPGISHRNNAVNHRENQYLRECLEKEKYRRKHCEEHINKQNTKLLELQQQLAVAVSTDKRKDLMIEQLDKQLAKVVEGWKKRETEKDELLKVLSQEKEQMEETLQSQQTMISSLERELSQTTEELREEKEKSTEMINCLKGELYEAQQEKEHLQESLRDEKDKHADMRAEWDDLKESKELAEKRAQQAQERLMQEQEHWLQKEKELSAKLVETQEANQRTLNMEKVKYEELKKKREDAETQSEEMKTELKKMILDLEQLIREKESQKVEMAIMEAKFESTQRKLEADLHAQMEKEIADQAAEFHSRIETSLEEASDRHRKQMAELQSRHQRDLERQVATLNEERQKMEDEYRKQLNELEEKLQELRAENLSLGQSKIKLESQRMEILTKLQYMMQSQWNEAVSLLVTTPQRKSLNSSFLSSQSGDHLVSAVPGIDRTTSLVSSGPTASRSQENEGHGHHESSDSSKHPPAVSTVMLENGKDERQEERDRMDRVEEYLQRLPHNMSNIVMRNDISVTRNELQSSEINQTSCPDSSAAMVPNNSAGLNYSNAVLHQHHSSTSGFGSGQESGGDEFHIKQSNNLSQSRPANVHSYVTGASGQAHVSSSGHVGSGHMTRTELRYQAVAMRSPQQSSSRYSSDSSHQSTKTGTDHPSIPTSQQHIFNTYPGHGSTPPPDHQRYHTRHPHEQKSRSSPQQPNLSRIYSNNHGTELRPLAGDFGDHKEVKLSSGSAANVNLYRPDSPTYISSPASIPASHWSLSSGMARQHYPSVPSLPSAAVTSPGPNVANRQLYSIESPVKRHRPRTSQQQVRHVDELKESLSPPVKQKAERDHSDTTSDASSGCLDSNRLLGNYSLLSERMEEHQNRQGELQHYVRMLLQKAPGSMCSEPERDQQFSDPEILESSHDLTVDLDLNDTATAVELTSQLTRLQQLREREQQFTRAVPYRIPRMQQAPNSSQSNESILSHLSEFIDDTDIISSQRLSEISKMLNLYRDSEIAGQANVASQLLDALKDASVSSSTENISRKDDKITQIVKNSPKSQQTRKVKDVAKTRKIRSESQSADASLPVTGCSLDNSTSSKQLVPGPPKKVPQPTESTKDKKAGPVKQPGGSRSSGGPAWK